MNHLLCLLVLISPAAALLGIGQTQSVAVQGRLICGGSAAQNVKVKLYEKESSTFIFLLKTPKIPAFDVKLDETSTNDNGEFRLAGHKSEITTIDPKINIYHKCNYKGVSFHYFSYKNHIKMG